MSSEPGTAVATADAPKLPKLGALMRRAANLDETLWTDERITAIKDTCCPPGTSNAQLAIFLSTAARYDLNPMLREIWLADMKQGEGSSSSAPKYSVVVGRDAFVKVMNNQEDFEGLITGVVYAKDTFGLKRVGDRIEVIHEMQGLDRGDAAGAYAILRRKGKPDQYIIRKKSQFQHLMGKSSWKNYLDDMLETRVIVAVGRRGYNLAGLEEQTVAEDVAATEQARLTGAVPAGAAIAGTVNTADELRKRLSGMQGGEAPPPGVDADGVVDVEVIDEDEGHGGDLSEEQLAEMEEKIRLENLRLNGGVDGTGGKSVD